MLLMVPSSAAENGYTRQIRVNFSLLPGVSVARISGILSRRRPAAPLWPVPHLQEMPAKVPQIPEEPNILPQIVDLPPDPWAKKQRERGSVFGKSKP